MKDWAMVWMILLLTGLMGCGQEEGPSPDDAELIPEEIPQAAQGSNAISVALKHYIVTTDKRLKEHMIQTAGLKFMNQSNPALAGGELQGITVSLEENLADAQKMLDNIRMARAERVESIKADLETLMSKMDERYDVAMGLARGAYKNEPDDELAGDEEDDKQPNPPAFDEDSFN